MKKLGLAVLPASCSRDVELCDSATLANKSKAAIAQCQAKGYAWVDCPERPRILKELKEELAQCSSY